MASIQETLQNISTIERLFTRHSTFPDYENYLRISYNSFLKSDSVILDVGANIGTHLENFISIAREGRILAFEPLPDIFEQLRRQFQPDGRKLAIHNLALSSQPDPNAVFIRAEGSLPESGLRKREYTSPSITPTEIPVVIETIDNVVDKTDLTRIDYIKMDIEGGEVDAIRGGARSISRFRPIISVEWGGQSYKAYGHEEDTLYEWAVESNYVIFDPFLQNIGYRKLWDAAKARYCWDYFLVPNEKVWSIKSPFFGD